MNTNTDWEGARLYAPNRGWNNNCRRGTYFTNNKEKRWHGISSQTFSCAQSYSVFILTWLSKCLFCITGMYIHHCAWGNIIIIRNGGLLVWVKSHVSAAVLVVHVWSASKVRRLSFSFIQFYSWNRSFNMFGKQCKLSRPVARRGVTIELKLAKRLLSSRYISVWGWLANHFKLLATV